jgi:transglutaminase-like putative cysteine protease
MNHFKLRSGLRVLLLAAIGLPAALSAAETNRYAGATWSLLEAKPVLAAAAGITLAQYPDCDDATVEERSVRVYHADGTAEAQDENFVKVLTEKGKRSNRTLEMGFQLPYNNVEVTQLEVIKPDGSVEPVDVAANSKETIDDSQMSMNIYDPNSRVLRVNLPKVEIGDIVHSVVRFTTLRSILPGEYTEITLFERPGYIRHIAYEVHAPKARPLKCIKVRDEIKGTLTSAKHPGAAGETVYLWEAHNVPRMFDEPGMPSYERVLQRLLVSTLPDWPAVSKWYWELSKPHLDATTPELKQQVAELTAGATNDLEKVKALFFFVSKKIRYMGLTPEKDRPGFEPHDVCLTFDKKYGVCRDKAALLVAMMRTAGLNAYPVLINVGTKRDADVPDPGFNHAIAGVELKKGEYILMDPTDENTRDLLPDYDRDQSFLVCRPEGEKLKTSPIRPPENNLMRVKTTGTLDAAGRLTAKTELWFDGVNDNAYRNAFAKMKPDDQRRFFERNLKIALPGAKLTSLKLMPADMLDMSSSLGAVIEFTADGMIATGSGKAVVSLPWVGKNFGIINFILGGTGLEQRKYPLKTEIACGLQETVALELAPDFTGAVSMPKCEPVNDKSLGYQETVAFKNQRLDASRELKLKIVEFSPAQYLKLKQTLELLEYDARKTPVLALAGSTVVSAESTVATRPVPPVDSNAEILDAHKTLAVQDAHTATYTVKYSKRIRTYLGKKREAEVKIEFNPACQEAKFIRGVVISKTGQRQEISPDEINVMDAGWNASAKRYTGGKILVANLPGVEIGSTIEVEFAITSKGRAFLSGYESFQFPDALDAKVFELTAPAELAVQSHVSGAPEIVQAETTTTNGSQLSRWTAAKVKALPAETQLPPEWVYAAGVGYFIGDASAYWKELNRVMTDRAHQNTRAAALAKELTGSAKTKVEAVKAIRDYISKSIRVAGPTFTELPLTELSAADTTLADGYGHLADRAILFHAMLSAAGLAPEFVMASALPPIVGITNVTASLPLPQNFDAPLVRVTVDGETYYLNDTDQYAQIGSTQYDDRLAVALATQAFETVKAAKDCAGKTDTFYSLTLGDNGKARIGIRCQYFGTDYNAKNKFFSELPPEEKNRYFQEVVSGVAQGARPIGGLTTKFDGYPGVEEFTVEIDHYCVVDGKNLYFDLPFTPSLFATGADQRTLPLYQAGLSDNTVHAHIQLPPVFQHLVIAPGEEQLELPAGAGSAVVQRSDSPGQFDITYRLQTAPAIISAGDYPSVLKLESTLGKKSARVFLLEQGK